MNNNKTRVTIGMPVFNGEKYIKNALDSILSQTFPSFEVIISDNASNDKTPQICHDYVAKDSRVRYFRSEKNIGGPKNYNRVFSLSNTEYFKWAAYDDVIAPEFLRKCINILDNDRSIVGCHCKTGRIDQYGNLIGYYNKGLLKRINSSKPHVRFRDFMGLYYTTTAFHGVYRRNLLAKSQLHGTYIGADRNLLAELSLMGRIYEIPEVLFFWRDHPDSYTSTFYGNDRNDSVERLRAELSWWSKDKGTFYPHWTNCKEYIKSINRVPLNFSQRILCYGKVLEWIRDEGYHFMAKDVIVMLMENSNIARRTFPFALSFGKNPFHLQ